MTISPTIQVKEGRITKSDYLHLVAEAGWNRYVNPDSVESALKNSLWSAVARDQETKEVIGCVRIVGDGSIFFYIQDLIVAKKYRKKGVGRSLMELADGYLKRCAPQKSYVGLFTHPTKSGFYEKFSFHGPRPYLIGMYKSTKV